VSEIRPASERIREFVLMKFPLARKREIKDADPLIEAGIIDSMGVQDLVGFLEHEFGVEVSDEELLPENFHSIEQLAAFVSTKRGQRTPDNFGDS
jgi:acyl carrier protein